jgi:hypothetical protein
MSFFIISFINVSYRDYTLKHCIPIYQWICSRESRFLDFFDFKYPTNEFGFAKEISDQCRKGVFFIFMSHYAEMSC